MGEAMKKEGEEKDGGRGTREKMEGDGRGGGAEMGGGGKRRRIRRRRWRRRDWRKEEVE